MRSARSLADDYSMALVGTPDRGTLWLLTRDPEAFDTARATEYVQLAESLGFDTGSLLYDDWGTRRTTSEATWA